MQKKIRIENIWSPVMYILLSFLACVVSETFAAPPFDWSLPDYTGQVLAISQDGAELYTAEQLERDPNIGVATQIVRWELATGKELGRVELAPVSAKVPMSVNLDFSLATFTPSSGSNTLLAMWTIPNSETRSNFYGRSYLQIYDLETGLLRGDLIRNVVWMGGPRKCFSPDGKWFWYFRRAFGEQVDVHSSQTGELVFTSKTSNKDNQPMAVAFLEGRQEMAILCNTSNNQKKIRVYSLPEGNLKKEGMLPKEEYWQDIRSWRGNQILVETSLEKDPPQQNPDEPPATRTIGSYYRRFYSIDCVAEDLIGSLREVRDLEGFYGQGDGEPSIDWETNAHRHVIFTEHLDQYNVIHDLADKEDAGFYRWKDIKVLDRPTGTTLLELKGIPFNYLVSPDGRYLIAAGASPNYKNGLYVWQIRK